jgi:hypothetical protein
MLIPGLKQSSCYQVRALGVIVLHRTLLYTASLCGWQQMAVEMTVDGSRRPQVSPDGLKVRKLIDTPIACANSTCFSPDGATSHGR